MWLCITTVIALKTSCEPPGKRVSDSAECRRCPRALGTVRGSVTSWVRVWTVCPTACSSHLCCVTNHVTTLSVTQDSAGEESGLGSAGRFFRSTWRCPGAPWGTQPRRVPDRATHAWHRERDGWTAGLSWDCPLGFPPVASPEELDFSRDSPGPPSRCPGGGSLPMSLGWTRGPQCGAIPYSLSVNCGKTLSAVGLPSWLQW